MLKIRRPLGRLIFNMGIAIPGKTVFLIETAPWQHKEPVYQKPWYLIILEYSGFITSVVNMCPFTVWTHGHRIKRIFLNIVYQIIFMEEKYVTL